MSEAIDLLTIAYEENGLEVVKELDKQVLSKGAWATIIYRYQDWDRNKECYGLEKYSIRRYQKSGDFYKPRSKFNISSRKQALQLIDILQTWLQDSSEENEADE